MIIKWDRVYVGFPKYTVDKKLICACWTWGRPKNELSNALEYHTNPPKEDRVHDVAAVLDTSPDLSKGTTILDISDPVDWTSNHTIQFKNGHVELNGPETHKNLILSNNQFVVAINEVGVNNDHMQPVINELMIHLQKNNISLAMFISQSTRPPSGRFVR